MTWRLADFPNRLYIPAEHPAEHEDDMGLNTPSEVAADLQIGATDQGMVRIYVSSDSVDLPLDFDPDDAEAIAEELIAAASAARRQQQKNRS